MKGIYLGWGLLCILGLAWLLGTWANHDKPLTAYIDSQSYASQTAGESMSVASGQVKPAHSPGQTSVASLESEQKLGTIDNLDSETPATSTEFDIASIEPFKITSSHADYADLLRQYRREAGPFMRDGTAYLYFENEGDPYFLASPPEYNALMLDDPDQLMELKVEEFNQSDGEYADNWGGDFSELRVSYHYCKQDACLLRANHDSVTFLRDYVDRYQQSHPELEITGVSTASGDLLLIYHKR
ncbi:MULTISPECIES: hypothetical protein [Shewanella]|uniref:Toxin co-regulated pilus biosynthesis protein Q C-terminal domain-containing protein n=1 Tax=Shewanella marisflavi TaxID=260364 RepID=A0ABX5WJ61_9GAMM|nr:MULTISPECIES: hypothetical protein [Shewanella]QDF73685.1 hypothetical protein FGA12_00025 [Shewanella marisflavi]